MSQIRVRVIGRRTPTPRDRIVEGNCSFVLSLEAQIPENSYIFVGAVPEKLPDYSYVMQRIKNLQEKAEREKRLDIAEIERTIKQLDIQKRTGQTRKLPERNNTKYIPGSSIRGAVRARIEYKFAPKKQNGGYVSYSCYSVEGRYFDLNRAQHHLEFWGEDVGYQRGGICRYSPERNNPVCVVCDIFGTMGLASRAFFSDALMTSGNPIPIKELDGIYVFTPGTKFEQEVTLFNGSYLDLGVLLMGFEIFNQSPILVGSYKYRFNPKLGTNTFRQRFAFGLLKYQILKIEQNSLVDGVLFNKSLNVQEVIETAKKALKESPFWNYIDMEKGVIK